MKYASKHRDPGSEDAQAGGSAGKIGMKAREGGSLNRTYIYIYDIRDFLVDLPFTWLRLFTTTFLASPLGNLHCPRQPAVDYLTTV